MSLSDAIISELATRVLHAQDRAHTISKLTDEYPQMSIADAYRVQDELRRRWIARGERMVGLKAGLTSKAKMLQMGVEVPSFGILSNAMARPENGAIAIRELVHPRVEAEIAFVLDKPLRGKHCTIEQVIDATAFVIPAVEVIDSRYEKFKFALPDSGGTLWGDTFVVPMGSPRKKNAETLMNYYYEPEVAAEVAAWVNYITPVVGAAEAAQELFPDIADNQLIFPNEETLSNAHIFRTLDSADDQAFNAEFQRVKLGA